MTDREDAELARLQLAVARAQFRGPDHRGRNWFMTNPG